MRRARKKQICYVCSLDVRVVFTWCCCATFGLRHGWSSFTLSRVDAISPGGQVAARTLHSLILKMRSQAPSSVPNQSVITWWKVLFIILYLTITFIKFFWYLIQFLASIELVVIKALNVWQFQIKQLEWKLFCRNPGLDIAFAICAQRHGDGWNSLHYISNLIDR